MTDETKLMPEFDFELKFDRTECGSAQYTYYGLVTDYNSPADILIRWPECGFGRKVDNAAEKAEALAKEVVKRWNATPNSEAVGKMRQALDDARKTFQRYYELHMEKAPPDLVKAEANLRMAKMCETALLEKEHGGEK